MNTQTKSNYDVIVIGAGLAGSSCAWYLAREGLSVLVLEKNSQIAQEASGNPAGGLIPHLTKKLIPESRFYLDAWNEILKHPLLEPSAIGKPGALHLAFNHEYADRFEKIEHVAHYAGIFKSLDRHEASDICGIRVLHGGLYYPEARMVSPSRFCQLSLKDDKITTQLNANVVDIAHDARADVWNLRLANGTRFQSRYIILANAWQAREFAVTRWLPVYTVRGQLLFLNKEHAFSQIKCSISYDGYISPPLNDGTQIVGSSFEHWNTALEINEDQQKEIFEKASQKIPDLKYRGWNWANGRVGFRTTSHDRLPIIGRLTDFVTLQNRLDNDNQFRHAAGLKWPEDINLPNVFLSVAHASRGLLGCSHGARLIVDMILNKTSHHDSTVIKALGANRFLKRMFRKHGRLLDEVETPLGLLG